MVSVPYFYLAKSKLMIPKQVRKVVVELRAVMLIPLESKNSCQKPIVASECPFVMDM